MLSLAQMQNLLLFTLTRDNGPTCLFLLPNEAALEMILALSPVPRSEFAVAQTSVILGSPRGDPFAHVGEES